MFFLDSIWLIPMFPLLGAALMLLFGRKLDRQHPLSGPQDDGHAGHHEPSPGRKLIDFVCPGMVLLSFLFALGAIIQLQGVESKSYEVVKWTWLAGLDSATGAGLRGFTADWGFLLDSLSAVMVLVVTGIGFLIHVYSTGYMAHDGGYYRFFGFLNLFLFFMLVLVLGNNYALLFVGWEGVGFCSFGLIGFYFRKQSASNAANKAFIVNRVGDAGFILGMLLTFSTLGTLKFTEVGAALQAGGFQTEDAWGPLTLMGLLFFVGAMGKSAQLPLHVWLPDAMEGPTPVSALIHAATMVTAGVYLVARSSEIYMLAPNAMLVVAVVGGLTAIFAASIGLVQYDIKKVLAYSTVSQLGYMFLACGVGAFWVGIFHLYTHAFFKALLFLGSGSVIHAVGGEQDMRKMGALRDKIPVTYKTMLVGALAIAGIPGLAGFFSKDEILWKTYSSHHTLLYALGLITAMMTAFYMFRLIYMTFFGDNRVDPSTHVHESPRSMTVPLVVLAVGSVLAGWVGTPIVFGPVHDALPSLEHWLSYSVAVEGAHGEGAEHHSALLEWGLMALSVGLALGAIWLATRMFRTARYTGEPMHVIGRGFHRLLLNKYFVDEIYGKLFVGGAAKGGGGHLAAFDRSVVDGAVNRVGWATRVSSSVTMFVDKWFIDGIVNVVGFGTKLMSYPVRMFQTGLVQNYALLFLIGVGIVAGYYLFW